MINDTAHSRTVSTESSGCLQLSSTSICEPLTPAAQKFHATLQLRETEK